MHFEVRRLRAGELDHELIWLAVTITSAVLLATWLALGLPLPRCTFRALFGVPCVTCGSTHAAIALFHGEFLAAWRFNPLATFFFFAIAIYDAYALIVLVRRTSRLRFGVARRYLVPLIIGAALLNWVFLLRHA
jgi:hypothetical protein